MAKNNDRVIELNDPHLLKLVEEKGALVEEGRAISRQMEAATKQHEELNNKQMAVMAKVTNKKLDIFKRLEKVAKSQIGEFEIPVTTEMREGKLVLVITDALAEFQQSFKTFNKFKQAVPRKK
jgi:hypothetical protein